MVAASTEMRARRGRPQSFDRAQALEAAMKLFWERGYEGTSFDDLTAAMHISPSSLCNAFGSKQRLYDEAVDHYVAAAGRWIGGILSAATDTRTAFERLIEATAEAFTRADSPAGCMIALAGTHVPPALGAVRDAMAAKRALAERLLADRLRQGVAAGDLPPETDVRRLAAYFSAVFHGMAVQARDGASRESLVEVGMTAMGAWPPPGLPGA